jgi:hypothetical protein
MFIPHEVFTPQEVCTLFHARECKGVVCRSTGSGGAFPSAGGSGGKRAPSGGSGAASPDGGSRAKPPKKNFLVKVYCNFIVNLYRAKLLEWER